MLRIDVREDGTEYHPYLGNVAGLRFMLKLRRSDVEGLAASEQEIRTLAELAREDLPESHRPNRRAVPADRSRRRR